jgi:hypothetical protein
MTATTIRQPRASLSLLSLVVAGVAATVAVAAIATDDVSTRPSQIVVAPLDENHPAAAPEIARPVPAEVPLDESHPAAAPDNARPEPAAVERPQLNPYIPPRGEDKRAVEQESLPFIPFRPQVEPLTTGAPVTRG